MRPMKWTRPSENLAHVSLCSPFLDMSRLLWLGAFTWLARTLFFGPKTLLLHLNFRPSKSSLKAQSLEASFEVYRDV